MPKRKVRDAMEKNIIAVLPGDTVEESARIMKDYNMDLLPVVSAGEVLGVFTDRDIVLKCIANGKNPRKTKVCEIMDREVLFVSPNQTLSNAIDIMISQKIKTLPVIDNGFIDGILNYPNKGVF